MSGCTWPRSSALIRTAARISTARLAAQDDIERMVSEATRDRNADELAKQLQYAGVEAVPVADFEDLLQRDPQLQFGEHFIRLDRPANRRNRFTNAMAFA